MKPIYQKMLRPVWRTLFAPESKLEQFQKISGDAFVVIGFQRNGTSLVSNLVSQCGVYFGRDQELKAGDTRNHNGFFEHNQMFALNRKLMREAGQYNRNDLYDEDSILRADSFFHQVSRAFTRRSMIKLLLHLGQGQKRFGFKSLPIFFYFWKHYMPKNTKIIGVYRHPLVGAQSIMRSWGAGAATFTSLLEHWTASNKNLLYHLATHESMLIAYDDLVNPSAQDKVLAKLVAFIGAGDIATLKNLIKPEFNRSSKEFEALATMYPLGKETEIVYEKLESLKI